MKQKKNPEALYEYQKARQQEYISEINEIISILNDKTKDRMTKLIHWYGKSKQIQSKAYQEMKSVKAELH